MPPLKKLLAKAGPFLGLLLVIALFSIPAETREFTKVNRITDLEEETAEAALMRGH